LKKLRAGGTASGHTAAAPRGWDDGIAVSKEVRTADVVEAAVRHGGGRQLRGDEASWQMFSSQMTRHEREQAPRLLEEDLL